MRHLLILLIAVSGTFKTLPQNIADQNRGIEAIIRSVDQDQMSEQRKYYQSTPSFEFEAIITPATQLSDLATIQKKAAKKFRVDLTFTDIKYDSTVLKSIIIDARSKTNKFTPVQAQIGTEKDFGVFSIYYQNVHCFFVGRRSSWPAKLHDAVAAK